MNFKTVTTLVLWVIFLSSHISCSLASDNSTEIVKSRPRRWLTFYPTSKILFRVLLKDTFPWGGQIFAHGAGFRANIELMQPDFHSKFLDNAKKRTKHKLTRRQVYDNLEVMISQIGFDGRACILKSLCDASNTVTPRSGMLFKLFKMIFTHSPDIKNNSLPVGDEKKYPYLDSVDCDELEKHCPLTLLEMSSYTDV